MADGYSAFSANIAAVANTTNAKTGSDPYEQCAARIRAIEAAAYISRWFLRPIKRATLCLWRTRAIPEISFGRRLSTPLTWRSRRQRRHFMFPGPHFLACSTARPTSPETWRCGSRRLSGEDGYAHAHAVVLWSCPGSQGMLKGGKYSERFAGNVS